MEEVSAGDGTTSTGPVQLKWEKSLDGTINYTVHRNVEEIEPYSGEQHLSEEPLVSTNDD